MRRNRDKAEGVGVDPVGGVEVETELAAEGNRGVRCRIESVDGRELTVVGLDAVSGTPVIDLKPVLAEFVPADVRQPEWVSRMMSEYFQP